MTPPLCVLQNSESIDPRQFKFCDFSLLFIGLTLGLKPEFLDQMSKSPGHCLNWDVFNMFYDLITGKGLFKMSQILLIFITGFLQLD